MTGKSGSDTEYWDVKSGWAMIHKVESEMDLDGWVGVEGRQEAKTVQKSTTSGFLNFGHPTWRAGS